MSSIEEYQQLQNQIAGINNRLMQWQARKEMAAQTVANILTANGCKTVGEIEQKLQLKMAEAEALKIEMVNYITISGQALQVVEGTITQ
jgi:hypothetical protein